MKISKLLLSVAIISLLFLNCNRDKLESKGFSISPETEDESTSGNVVTNKDTLKSQTRPSSVLLTGFPEYRLTTIYKLNYNKKEKRSYIGSNHYYRTYLDQYNREGNNWHYNFMPGLEAVYGYNFVNVSFYDITTNRKKQFFSSPVLIKTLYYPSFTKDTLYNLPVKRNYYMVSAYDEDTNGDSIINVKDLRRFYFFDIEVRKRKALVPSNYSVISSEYDPANDLMYVFAQLDENNNGKRDDEEDIHVFWIDLKNPNNTGRQY